MMPSSITTFTSLLSLFPYALAAVIPRQQADAVGQTRSGAITYYNPGGATGSCGQALSDSEAIVAVSTSLYDQYTIAGNPNNNSLCGKKIQVTSGGKTTTVTVSDRCGGCGLWDLDMSPSSFTAIVAGGEAVGRTVATWQFID